jgi:hypothetical protein
MNPLAGVLGEAWAMYRSHIAHLLTISFGIYVVAALLGALFTATLGVFGALLASLVGLVAAFLVQAALVKAVEDVRDGRADLSFADTLRAARPAVLSVAGASILAGIAIGVGLLLLIVPGLFLLTIWCLIVPVIVLERAGVGAAFGRSRELVKGFGWQVFGTIVMVFLVAIALGIVISLLLSPLPDTTQQAVSNLVSGTLFAPFSALVVTLAYFRLHHAKQTTGSAGYAGGH